MTNTTRKTPTQIALAALSRIEIHERECSMRWADAQRELRSLRERWERLAWLIIGTVIVGVVTVVINSIITPLI